MPWKKFDGGGGSDIGLLAHSYLSFSLSVTWFLVATVRMPTSTRQLLQERDALGGQAFPARAPVRHAQIPATWSSIHFKH